MKKYIIWRQKSLCIKSTNTFEPPISRTTWTLLCQITQWL